MEARAPYHAAPRNLARPLAAWLRRLGFSVLEQEKPQFAAVEANWIGPRGERFQFAYSWSAGPHADATCRLSVLYAGQGQFETLFTPQKVRRLKEARQLLLGCVRYANARTLAALPDAVNVLADT